MVRQLGVDEQRRAGECELSRGLAELALVDVREVVDAGVDEEAFEAARACLEHRPQLVRVAGDDAAPELRRSPRRALRAASSRAPPASSWQGSS